MPPIPVPPTAPAQPRAGYGSGVIVSEGEDGIETFAEMRRHPEVKETPVCVVTGHPEFRKLIYDRAVPPPDGYMAKPIDRDEILEMIKGLV